MRTPPGVRCRETAAALGLDATEVLGLAGLDVGRWRGSALEEVGAEEPEAVGRWRAAPGAAPHGGESARALCDRVAGWLDGVRGVDGRIVAVVEPEIVRAVVVRVPGAPEAAFWRVDVPPLTATELSGRAGRRNIKAGRPLAGDHAAGAS